MLNIKCTQKKNAYTFEYLQTTLRIPSVSLGPSLFHLWQHLIGVTQARASWKLDRLIQLSTHLEVWLLDVYLMKKLTKRYKVHSVETLYTCTSTATQMYTQWHRFLNCISENSQNRLFLMPSMRIFCLVPNCSARKRKL